MTSDAHCRICGHPARPGHRLCEVCETVPLHVTDMIGVPYRDTQRCSLCSAPATVTLPPWAGSEALCRACADRLRAYLTPPDEAERRALAAISSRPVAPRCPCPECSRG